MSNASIRPVNTAFELTWTLNEETGISDPSAVVRYPRAESDDTSPIQEKCASMEICSLPRCSCLDVYFDFTASDAEVEGFWYNLEDSAMSHAAGSEQESSQIAQTIRSHITKAQIHALREWFFTSKLRIVERTPPEEICLHDLPPAHDGRMIGFVDVFPCGLGLNFESHGATWAIDEQYCVKRRCDCQSGGLSFLRLGNSQAELPESISDPLAVLYDYKTQKCELLERGPSGSPSYEALLSDARSALHGLDLRLELHHNILKLLYGLHREQHLTSLARLPTSQLKVGRNDPCPCGSGKKYKRCCAN